MKAVAISAPCAERTSSTMIGIIATRGIALKKLMNGREIAASVAQLLTARPASEPTASEITVPIRAVTRVWIIGPQIGMPPAVPESRSQSSLMIRDGELMKNGSRNPNTEEMPGICGRNSHAASPTTTRPTCQSVTVSRRGPVRRLRKTGASARASTGVSRAVMRPSPAPGPRGSLPRARARAPGRAPRTRASRAPR